MRAVHVGGVEKCDAELERAMKRRDRLLFVAVPVKIRHAHATETDRRNDRSAASKFALFHICPIHVRGAHSSQRSRMFRNVGSSSGPASDSFAFCCQRSGFFVPTMAVCTPGMLRVKRSAIEMLFSKSPCRKS